MIRFVLKIALYVHHHTHNSTESDRTCRTTQLTHRAVQYSCLSRQRDSVVLRRLPRFHVTPPPHAQHISDAVKWTCQLVCHSRSDVFVVVEYVDVGAGVSVS